MNCKTGAGCWSVSAVTHGPISCSQNMCVWSTVTDLASSVWCPAEAGERGLVCTPHLTPDLLSQRWTTFGQNCANAGPEMNQTSLSFILNDSARTKPSPCTSNKTQKVTQTKQTFIDSIPQTLQTLVKNSRLAGFSWSSS